MQSSLVFTLVVVGATVVAADRESDTGRYDKVSVQQVLGNPRIYKQYLNCLLEQGFCISEAEKLKNILPEVLRTGCEQCSPLEREMARKVISYIRSHKPEDWYKLVEKYDPRRLYTEKLERFLASDD